MINLSEMNSVINDLSDEQFEYGKCDCYIFTAKLVKAWHGKDYLSTHAVYNDKQEADAYMERFGGIEALTTGMFGYPVASTECQDGDVVSFEMSPGEVGVGFVFGDGAFFKCKTKPVKIPLKKCRKGWRVK